MAPRSQRCDQCGSELSAYPRNPPVDSSCPFCGFCRTSLRRRRTELSPVTRIVCINAPVESSIDVGGYKFCSQCGQANAIADAYYDGSALHVTVNWRHVKVADDTIWVDNKCYGIVSTADHIHISPDGWVSINGDQRPPVT